VLATGKHMRQG